eukprot:COSAG02_NODE_4006_length_5921_cov_5.626589_6_plen_188_part_00
METIPLQLYRYADIWVMLLVRYDKSRIGEKNREGRVEVSFRLRQMLLLLPSLRSVMYKYKPPLSNTSDVGGREKENRRPTPPTWRGQSCLRANPCAHKEKETRNRHTPLCRSDLFPFLYQRARAPTAPRARAPPLRLAPTRPTALFCCAAWPAHRPDRRHRTRNDSVFKCICAQIGMSDLTHFSYTF